MLTNLVPKPIRILPQFLYVEPTSVCNLHCKMCYTNVINGANRRVIAKETILDFVAKFCDLHSPPVTVYWCGTGEVLMHPDFPAIINTLLAERGAGISHIIQTNGTVSRLDEFKDLSAIEFRISIDGLRDRHEWHRGDNTYDRTLKFCRKAIERGCRGMVVRMLLTRDNIHELDAFHAELVERIGPAVRLLLTVPFTNRALRVVRSRALAIVQQDIEDINAIPESEARQILAEKYQNRYVIDEDSSVDNYLSLTTYGVHSCCHGVVKIGEPSANITELHQALVAAQPKCRSCAMFPCV